MPTAMKSKKRAMIQPTWPVLTPMPQPVINAPEKVHMVGEQTGNDYMVMGDNPMGQETFQVTPPPGGRAMPAIQAGPVSMAGGGYGTVGYNPAEDPMYAANPNAYAPAPKAAPAPAAPSPFANAVENAVTKAEVLSQPAPSLGISGTGPDPVAGQYAASRALIGARSGQLDAQGRTLDAQGNVINAREATLPYQEGVLNARTNVANATAGTFAPSRAVINAEGNVINQQAKVTQGTRALIGQQQQANNERMTEEQGIQAAAKNVTDITNVARARRVQGERDYVYDMAGLQQPEEVVLPPDFAGSLPLGLRQHIQTQQEILQSDADNAEKLRALKLDNAKLAVQLMATDVDTAQQVAARAGLTLKSAQLLVDQAQNEATRAGIALDQSELGVSRAQIGADRAQLDQSRAGIGVGRAQLGVDSSELPPSPGMVIDIDPMTGASEWVTPAEKTIRQERRNARGLSGNELAAFSPSYIVGLVISQQIDDKAAADALVAQGYTPYQANLMIQQGKLQSQNSGDGSDIV